MYSAESLVNHAVHLFFNVKHSCLWASSKNLLIPCLNSRHADTFGTHLGTSLHHVETEWNSFTHLFPFLSLSSAYLVGFDMNSLSKRVSITEPLHVLSQHFDGDVTRIFLTPPFFCFSDQLWERNNMILMASTHLLWLPALPCKIFGRWHLTRQPMNLSPYFVALMILLCSCIKDQTTWRGYLLARWVRSVEKLTFTNLYLNSTSHSHDHHHHHHMPYFPHLCTRPEFFASEW